MTATTAERPRQPLPPRHVFLRRLLRSGVAGLAIVAASLLVGMSGYHGLEGLPWLDAFLNAAMILAGMGPVDPVHSAGGKLFAGCYAIYSGIALLTATGVMFAPLVHRFLHRFHLEAL